MAVTRVNVSIPMGVWTNLYAASGIAVGTEVMLFNKDGMIVKIAASLAAPTTVDGFLLYAFTAANEPLDIPPGEPGLWAYSPIGTATILIQEQATQRHSAAAAWTTQAHAKGMDFYTAVGLGMVPGVRRVAALGNNPDIDTGTFPETVWTGGGLYPWMTAATSLEIVSTSASDAAVGVGAITVLINGLDINYVEVAQTITLNGLTPIAIPIQLFRINNALVMTSGSTQTNVGDINIRDAGAGTVRGIIPAGYGITRQAVYTVPAGFTLSVHSILGSMVRSGASSSATIATFFRSLAGTYRLPLEFSISDTVPYRHEGIPGIISTEKTDVALRCTFVSANNTALTAAFLGILIANTTLAQV
jgi:hypothetical protein